MSIPNEALQKAHVSDGSLPVPKLVQEIESRALQAQQQINIVKAQIAAKQRDIRLLQLTSSEVGSLPEGTKIYEGVGKMYVKPPSAASRPCRLTWPDRFIYSRTADVGKRLASEVGELKADIANLEKKLHYLETTHRNSRDHMEQIFRTGGKA
ncbi:hypothetical protein GP486_005404 [Trichoglossum hirsutum]|uniref:Prefoldin subunit 1 n=1 Tax=Trichoglossum hirsutum TaxID=265104 RepID=A0A9P8L983_9PEZI|nr:hypothetical protein GP486_005404 [Trichoglossum hirsutum]